MTTTQPTATREAPTTATREALTTATRETPTDRTADEAADLFGAPANGFASQADAETWLGTVWRNLAADGVGAASLFEDDRLVYGPMSLEPS
jgi:hypothetical protein